MGVHDSGLRHHGGARSDCTGSPMTHNTHYPGHDAACSDGWASCPADTPEPLPDWLTRSNPSQSVDQQTRQRIEVDPRLLMDAVADIQRQRYEEGMAAAPDPRPVCICTDDQRQGKGHGVNCPARPVSPPSELTAAIRNVENWLEKALGIPVSEVEGWPLILATLDAAPNAIASATAVPADTRIFGLTLNQISKAIATADLYHPQWRKDEKIWNEDKI